jgi:high-affinity iron transporter
MTHTHRRSVLLAVVVLVFLAGAGRAQEPEAVARRMAAATAIAVEEYAAGVVGGRVVSEAEVEEARLFIAEAKRLAVGLPPAARSDALRLVERLAQGVHDLADVTELERGLAELRTVLVATLGIVLDPLPEHAPSLALGSKLYGRTCATCHGATGQGDGPAAAGLDPPPADFTDAPALGGTSPLDFFRKISVGVAGTAMAGYEQTLSVEQRWALALYVSGLRFTDSSRGEGRRWIAANCQACELIVSDWALLLGAPDDSIARLLSSAGGGSVPPEAVAFGRTAGAAELLGMDRVLEARRTATKVETLVGEAVRLSAAGDREQALGRSVEAYLQFEPLERDIAVRSAARVRAAEAAFARLRTAIHAGEPAALAAARAEVRESLQRALETVTTGTSPGLLFGQSLLIIVREGLEAILILGALTAFVAKAGAPERGRDVALGAGAAGLASAVTAALFATIVRTTVTQREALEGVTMLVASTVLFWVSSWMVSKVEARRWHAFVADKTQRALSGGSAAALIGVAFLAVYREGVETVLFYAALVGLADDPAGAGAIALGFGVGAALLALAFLAMRRWGMRIPMRPFFAVTGMLLTTMSVSFAGQGVAELQEAGWVPATPVNLPALPALGVFPTVQTFAAQLGVVAAFGAALFWIFRPRPQAVGVEVERGDP